MIKYVAIMIALSGCVTAIPLSDEETCSLEGMTLGGVTVGRESGGAVAFGQTGNNIYVNSYVNSRHLMCRPAHDSSEKCGISANQKSIKTKNEFNSGVSGRRFLTGLGYMFYFLPGALINSHYEGLKTNAIDLADDVRAKERRSCEQGEARLPSANNFSK